MSGCIVVPAAVSHAVLVLTRIDSPVHRRLHPVDSNISKIPISCGYSKRMILSRPVNCPLKTGGKGISILSLLLHLLLNSVCIFVEGDGL